ncbi:MAG: DEAD/DEAH box helicase [Deltaproteobacteria bacterium CG12_big_fil_rev_8_21_14_0_65_43_10]|nr:MAG: DEAD/DEAH box helicase [Deltaproteobacteria bacterium CG2_30_43_15]PIQ45371.1 MAG: DEAD/DEAH box helicase [Deltaproteobacteria bacterium CG12_big_fil_rev_8_21_14_0_65_43_10]PIU86623.1 MAG: DEAD/DEAH box helicase [Deltaproteobacteria bacterium CG06_land_8_20_14_3_00_44_19]PIX26708.1 MAG: DEAD/DEAH box helicase [Deltaproteobacteria bacterium CG_4_8_14_3_um_filter_43_13]PIZ20131.1 MAG: DEAD/DEAH box helicase [Deltaproteobacteria bacterium CG_4_10_14_0_8_um_filter_43_12]PJB44753.1 MAG: DEA
MTIKKITESEIETYSLDELQLLGFSYIPGPSIAPDVEAAQGFMVAEPAAFYGVPEKRGSYSDVVLKHTLEHAINRLNPALPETARQEALKATLSVFSPQLIDANEAFHKMLAEGIPVSVRIDGQERGERVWLVDFQNPENNSCFAINQYTVQERNQNKRPDVILFINGLPLVVIELKNPADELATIRKAFDQIQTYKAIIPSLFFYNAFCVISDGLEAKAGTISSAFSRFQAWKNPSPSHKAGGREEWAHHDVPLQALIKGMLNKTTLLDLIRNFIVFEKEKKIDIKTGLTQSETIKKIGAYHQYHAVNKAVESTRLAIAEKGNRKAGVIWHTQGSGKSISMVFYAGKLIHNLDNPTIVVITDRNDLDQQLFDTFAGSTSLLGQAPVQAESREHLQSLLKVASGGIVFTTIQKFFPDTSTGSVSDTLVYEKLSERRNIIVIADEAHRTQYGFKAKLIDTKDESGATTGKRIGYGFAKYLRDALPNAAFIGFTGTPVESTDINTPAVFGNYVDIYDIAQAVEDGATVKIYYESRLAKVNLTEEGRELIKEFEREMIDDDASVTQKAKAKWTKLEAIVGQPERLKNLARDIVSHYEKRAEIFDGKAMIVAMSRRIAVALYDEIIAIRPNWHSEDLKTGTIKVVMTSSSSDKLEFDPEDPEGLVIPAYHRTNKEARRVLSERMKDPQDPLKLVIVRDMWLTGFDVPCLHTMYIDKLMKRHTLMQAIARVNRVFGDDKKGGLVVDYIGIGNALKEAMAFYANSGGKGNAVETQEKALEMLLEKIEVVRQMFHGFDYIRFFSVGTSERLSLILQAEEFILSQEQGKDRFIKESTTLLKLFALAIPHEDALALTDEVAFFQSVRARLLKFEGEEGEGKKSYETAIRQIVTQAVESTEVVDIFEAAGIQRPDISLLSEEFLQEVKEMKHKNLGIELLKKILNDEIKVRLKFNITEGKNLLEMLETSIRKYQNNLLTTAEIIEELLAIARQIRTIDGLAEKLKLTKDEFAFYTALEINDSAVKVLGEETLKSIAREIADKVRKNATIDWAMKESARAKLMVIVRRTLNKYGYPPDKQQKAVDTVLKQAEVLADYWVNK